MADTFTKKKRSEIMSRILSKHTGPEMKIRRGLHAKGYRFTLHDKNLPGKPDVKLTKYGAIIEIKGCFWHGHDCHGFKTPKTRSDYWNNKIERTRERDKENIKDLLALDWRVAIVWECSMRGKNSSDLLEIFSALDGWLKSKSVFIELRGLKNE